MKTHYGCCHCGRVKFEFDAEVDHARECNCSICSLRGTMNFRVSKEAFRLTSGSEYLSEYVWGSKTATDYFCSTCGVMLFRKPSELTPEEIAAGKAPFEGWAVNLRCVKQIDLSSLPIMKIDGASLKIRT